MLAWMVSTFGTLPARMVGGILVESTRMLFGPDASGTVGLGVAGGELLEPQPAGPRRTIDPTSSTAHRSAAIMSLEFPFASRALPALHYEPGLLPPDVLRPGQPPGARLSLSGITGSLSPLRPPTFPLDG
jgi:hypothetical protein